MYSLLDTIDHPDQLRKLPREQLPRLAAELRSFIVDSVARTGGHLSSNLGTIELTIALHYVYNTPEDRLVWDVGHQTYAHKILTGRRQDMSRLRMHGGISGFPKRTESPFDTFGVGHSSTSISAALGMALAAQRKGEDRRAVAIIGDGAMTAGQSFEGLNNAGVSDSKLLVILNDNDMSISAPVGALNKYLARLLSGRFYVGMRDTAERVLSVAPPLLEFAKRAEEHVKGMITPGTLFEEFGFNYIGPIDGHDLDSLIPTLENLRLRNGPQFLHVITRKGQGYKMAEVDPVLYHGVSKFEPAKGIDCTPCKEKNKLTFTQVFGTWLCDMARVDSRLIGITPAMGEGSGLTCFEREFPDRYYDVGIAEQHALTFAAGMACEGLKPVVAIYSTFLQRAYDQLIHDVALQNLDVTLAIDRGGLVGADGATHHGAFDLSYLTCIPNLVIMAPADEAECRRMLSTAYLHPGPAAVRYTRGGSGLPESPMPETLDCIPLGKAEMKRQGNKVAILAFGTLVHTAMKAGETLDATVVNMRFIKPIDSDLIIKLAGSHSLLVSLEENALIGGAGAEVARVLESCAHAPKLLRLGLPDQFIDHGDQSTLLAETGLNTRGVIRSISEALSTIET